MPPETLTEEQQSWTRRVLGLLGKRSRSTDGDESKEGQTEEDKPVKYYGGSEYKAFDTRKAPKPLRKALSKKPPRMITAGDWNTMAVSVSDVRSNYGNKQIAKIKDNLDKVGANDKKFNQGRKKCLELLDAKENNPERTRIGQLLIGFQGAEDTYEKGKTPGPLTQNLIDAKHKRLADLQKQLFEWNDRRAQQNLPPSNESVAMGDLLQQMHQEFIADVASSGRDLPITGGGQLSQQERGEIQQTWRNLRDGGGPVDGNQIVIPTAPGGAAKNQKDADRFRNQMLSNFGRLLQTEVGRGVVRKLNASGFPVEFVAGTSASCGYLDFDEARPSGNTVVGEDVAKQNPGAGSGARIGMVMDAKDSDVALTTRTGNILHGPRFIAMGHEMIHALHFTRGMDRTKVDEATYSGTDWGDLEEFHTIHRSKTSEQSLRNQYGLSAERWGHSDVDPTDSVKDDLKDELDATTGIENGGRQTIDNAVQQLGFDPAALGDKIKWAIYQARANLANHGATLSNLRWDANKLTVAQMRGIVANNIDNTLERLGWTPYQLPNAAGPYPSIQTVVSTKRHHERSPKGRRYQTLGGDLALAQIPTFNTAAGATLATGAPADWETQLAALEGADAWLMWYRSRDNTVQGLLTTHKKLKKRLEVVGTHLRTSRQAQTNRATEVTTQATVVTNALKPASINRREQRGNAAQSPRFMEVITAMRAIDAARTNLVNGTITADVFRQQLRDFGVLAATVRDEFRPSQDVTDQARMKACRAARNEAINALNAIKAVNDQITQATSAIVTLTPEVAKRREGMLVTLEQMIASPYTLPANRLTAQQAVNTARNAL